MDTSYCLYIFLVEIEKLYLKCFNENSQESLRMLVFIWWPLFILVIYTIGAFIWTIYNQTDGSNKQTDKRSSKRPLWHYIALPIIGIICFVGAALLVRILF